MLANCTKFDRDFLEAQLRACKLSSATRKLVLYSTYYYIYINHITKTNSTTITTTKTANMN